MENAASIVSKFGQALVEELQEIRGVGNKIVHLRDELSSMNAVLRMLAEADDDCVDHLVREWTKQVRELASDAEDCVDIYKLRVRRPLPRLPVDPGAPFNCARRLLGHARLLPAIVRHQFLKLYLKRCLAADLPELLDRMVIINERRARYGVDQEALRRSATFATVSPATVSARALRPSNDHDQFIGLTDQVNALADKLRSGDDKDMKVFSIVGFGGLGKTTLAMEVCRELEVDFPHQAQASVSQAFDGGKDLEGLLKRMLHQMAKQKSDNKDGIKEEDVAGIDGMDVPGLTGKLQDLLRDKRYLIVIDDVWTIPAWDAIRSILPTDNKYKSRIIVTTRVDSVAKACSSVSAALRDYFVHEMKPLEKEVSKQLFINRVFGPEGACPEELKSSMLNILRKCGGLPLAIVSMASLLASYKSPGSKDMWDKICNSIGSQLESNPTLEGMRQIVTLSYSHLPHHLKTCMMYLSIFPEDYEIKKKRLLSRWIAEGLVAEKRGLTLLEVAESYFDELVSRNMIVPANISYDGRVKSCRVHDMMLEVMVSRSMEANFVSLVGGEQHEGESLGKIRRLSIQSSGGPKDERSMKHVRSLSTFHPEGHHQLLERLGDFTLLRVLDLEDCKALQNKHMKHVCRMFLLRFLNLNGTDISKMPKKIGKLVHLQTLSLRNTLLHYLHQSVTELEKLESLYFLKRASYEGWRLPCGLGRMKALRVMDKMALYDDDDSDAAREIGELTQLRKLNITVNCSQEVLQVLITALNRTYSLRQLSIFDRGDGKIMNILGEMTSPPLLLRSMKLRGEIDGMPEWIGSLMHVVKLHITFRMLSCDEILGILCELPNLLRLTLAYRSCINDALVISAKYRFPVLKQLSVDKPFSREEIIFEQGSMAMLEKLEVGFGYQETSLSSIEHLPSLKVVVLVCFRSNRTLNQTVLQLKLESDRRPVPNQFKVVARYVREGL
ncbi:hypothetical protein CFC21_075348 [Triticum aestivum]|uniref:Uncharacterized protein n=2 Tax=Triticum aestivum TaxID=4565 RepID=A0A3B6MJ32_WHEAT|nr:hypothetical protein CFC21_075348 [Triticum aestivum]